MENLLAATRIANSLQPSGSAAEGIEHLAFYSKRRLSRTLKLVNHSSEFTLSHPSRALLSPFTLPEGIGIIHPGTGEILMMNTTMSSLEIQSFAEMRTMQLGGGMRTM